ncbi:hypothetical protein KCU98_g2862, partial [Aureobasidium melanogenum]
MANRLPPEALDPGYFKPDTDESARVQPQNHTPTQHQITTELVEYDLRFWERANGCATHHEYVVVWVHEKFLEMFTYRVRGWFEGDISDEPDLPAVTWHRDAVDIVHYDRQEWMWATRMAKFGGYVRKDIFDAILKRMDPIICRSTPLFDVDPMHPPRPPPPQLPPHHHRPAATVARRRIQVPLPAPAVLVGHPILSNPMLVPGLHLLLLLAAHLVLRHLLPVTPVVHLGALRIVIPLSLAAAVLIPEVAAQLAVRRGVASQQRIARERNRAAAHQAARQRGRDVIILD